MGLFNLNMCLRLSPPVCPTFLRLYAPQFQTFVHPFPSLSSCTVGGACTVGGSRSSSLSDHGVPTALLWMVKRTKVCVALQANPERVDPEISFSRIIY